jgi:hypothetical protein
MSVDKKWLIKSDNKIVGPYSTDQLENLLLQRQVALIDEIRDMDNRWLYIREVAELKVLTEQIRLEHDKKSEQTRTYQTSGANTNTVSQTKTAETPDIDFTNHASPIFTDVHVETKDVPFNEIEIRAQENEKKKNTTQFVFPEDSVVKAEVQKSKKQGLFTTLTVAVLLTLSTVGYFFYNKWSQDKVERALVTKVRRLVMIGADSKAVEAFQKLTEDQQNKVLPDILTLFTKLDSDGVINTDNTLKDIKTNPTLSAVQKSQIALIQFNKSLLLNQLNEAKGFLVIAKDLDPDSDVIKENSAILSYLENNTAESAAQFLSLFNRLNKGRLLYGYALNHLQEPQISDVELLEKIERYLSTRIEYKKELILVQILLAMKISNMIEANNFIQDFMNTPVMLSHQFKIPGLVYPGIYKIERVIPTYEKVKNQLGPRGSVLTDIYVYLEKNDAYSAQKLFNQEKNQFSNAERTNINIAINYIQNKSSDIFAIEKTVLPESLNISSHMSLILLKKENKRKDIESNVLNLKKQKNLISVWTDLIQLSEEDPEKIRSYLQLNTMNTEEFIPYIDLRGRYLD